MGKSLVFVRGLGTLKVKNATIYSFHAKYWLMYLEHTMGVKAVNPQVQLQVMGYVNGWQREWTRHQLKIEGLNSWS